MPSMSWRSLRAMSRLVMRRADLQVEGLEHIPSSGPVMIAARHFHHLYDGPALITAIPKQVHIVVALDWIKQRPLRGLMQRLCDQVGWPTVIRTDAHGAKPSAESRALLRRATMQTVRLLQQGEIVVMFPEGYPNIDPTFTPKPDDEAFLPFQAGVVRLAALAATPDRPVLIVPTGFCYRQGTRTAITLRFGTPIDIQRGDDLPQKLRQIEEAVTRLSMPDA
jgi:1-acyl-sn-glycerol-3-phosphate acyltransferase